MHLARLIASSSLLFGSIMLNGCASGPPEQPPSSSPEQAREMIATLLPHQVRDRGGWSTDIESAMRTQRISASKKNACAVIAVVEQESGFQVNPVVPGLPAMAWREIDQRAQNAGIPVALVHGTLRLASSNGSSFADRIEHAHTEKDLSDIYEDFISLIPLGQRLFADRNPVRTRGPMQVNVSFARAYAANHPYPYDVNDNLSDELFTRRGSVFFGTAHLFDYEPPYDDYIYRFADYNAGQFASRNAAFQKALGMVAGTHLQLDGALLPHDPQAKGAGSTARVARSIAARLELDERGISAALNQGRSHEFERTALYRQVFATADRINGRPVPRAVIPNIELHGAKLSRTLSTDWYAHRVNSRFRRCMATRQ